MSVEEFKALARKHWEKWLPAKVAALKAEGKLNEALQGAALLAQDQYEHWLPQIRRGEGDSAAPVHTPKAGGGRNGRRGTRGTGREGTPVPEEPAGVAGLTNEALKRPGERFPRHRRGQSRPGIGG
jgi:hypothetical protein